MKKHFLYLACASLLVFGTSYAQTSTFINKKHAHDGEDISHRQRSCGTMEHHAMLLQNDPGLAQRVQQIENEMQDWIANHYNPAERVVYTIPVVFHVVYANATENIPDQRMIDQLQVLNEDFRKLNADAGNVPSGWQSIAADCEINFCMATQDPNGNATNGITRTSTSTSSFNTNDNVKFNSSGGKDAWPAADYLNIWVCDLGPSLLGYAQFPGGPANTDGVVLNYRYTGTTGAQAPFNKGRTATHEVGHWLNLFHIWGDDGGSCSGSDLVSDTPNQADATGGCFSPGQVLTDGCATSSPGYMWQNYMDYTDDACMYMFTNGQKTRVQACMAGTRNSLASSQGCAGSTVANDGGINAIITPTGTLCSTTFTPVVTLRNFGAANLTSITINYRIDAGPIQNYSWTGNLASMSNVNVTLNSMTTTAGNHTFTAYTTSPNSQTDGNTSNDQTVGSFTVAATGASLPYSQGFESTTFPPTGITLTNSDGATTWARTTAADYSGVASAFMDNYDYNANGEVDEMILPNLNLASTTNPALTFQVAYRMYTNPTANPNYSDTLKVLISTDCGVTWSTLYNKYSSTLATVTPTYSTTEFVPSGTSQWRLETISLSPYSSAQNAVIKFRHSTQYENNMYLDDINIQTSTNVASQQLSNNVNLFPNPTSGQLSLSVVLPQNDNLKVRVLNTLGQSVHSFEQHNTFGGVYNISLEGQSKGIYFVEITTGTETVTKRVVLNGN